MWLFGCWWVEKVEMGAGRPYPASALLGPKPKPSGQPSGLLAGYRRGRIGPGRPALATCLGLNFILTILQVSLAMEMMELTILCTIYRSLDAIVLTI